MHRHKLGVIQILPYRADSVITSGYPNWSLEKAAKLRSKTPTVSKAKFRTESKGSVGFA